VSSVHSARSLLVHIVSGMSPTTLPSTARVTTWNVLASLYTPPERYHYVEEDVLAAKSRWGRSIAVISDLLVRSDVVALQEVEGAFFARLLEELSGRTSTFVYAPHEGRGEGAALLSRHTARGTGSYLARGRGVASATFDCGGVARSVVSTHLPFRSTPEEPALVLDALLEILPSGDAVVAMDSNAPWGSAALLPLVEAGFTSDRLRPSPESVYAEGAWHSSDLVVVRGGEVTLRGVRGDEAIPNRSWTSDHVALTGTVVFS
jgi:endonuclease/exonuclease/phosphatase family metal-dependent hydrolase